MKNPFTFFWQRGNNTYDVLTDLAAEQQQADAQVPADPYEVVKQAEREHLMLGDETTQRMLLANQSLHAFIPALASVNRTTKHISKVDAKISWLDFQILSTLVEMTMPPEDYENGMVEKIQGLEMQHNTLISDGWEGWKGRILTEQKKIHETLLRKK